MRRIGDAWAWVRRHPVDLLLPPAAFLLAAGVAWQVQWTRHGLRYARTEERFQAALQARQKGNRDTAVKELLAAAAAAPDDAQILLRLAVGLQSVGQPARAAPLIERAVRLKPPKLDTYAGLVRTYCDLGQYQDAERVLRQDVFPRWPASAEAAYYAGLIHLYREKGDSGPRQAANSFERCLRRNPRHVDARYRYALCLSRLGRPVEAERAFKEVLRIAPTHAGSYQGLAGVLLKHGRVAEAKQALAEFKRLDDSGRRVGYLETRRALKQARTQEMLELGQLYLALDQPARAEAPLAEYVLREPTDPRGHRKLAAMYRGLKAPVNARSEERLAAALASQAGEAQR
jgi:tetratricopeptide (TPR) repeat protein